MPHWVEDLRYSVEVFTEAGSREQVLARLHDLEAARAAYAIALPKHPGKGCHAVLEGADTEA